MKDHPGIDRMPFGIHAVVRSEKPGVIFVLKNVNNQINIKNQNRLHPFYMVYVGDDGEILCNHLEPKIHAGSDAFSFQRQKSPPN